MRFSHVDCRMPDSSLYGSRSDSVGGAPPGVHFRIPDYESWKLVMRMQIRTTIAQERDFYAFLADQERKPYDKTDIWGFVLDRDWRESDSWFCSELIAAAQERAKIFPLLCTPNNKLIPGTLATVNSSIPGTTWQSIGGVKQ